MSTSIIIGLIISALSKMKNLDVVKKAISNVIGISGKLERSAWLNAVKDHLSQHPFAYSTILSVLSINAPDSLTDIFNSVELSQDDHSHLSKMFTATSFIPPEYRTGGDGDPETVWGRSQTEFATNVAMIKKATIVVDTAAAILGITPNETIELAMLLRSIEPEFSQLY